MATSGQVNKGGIAPAIPYAGGSVFHTGAAAPPTTTTGTDAVPVITEEYVAEVLVHHNCLLTGVSVLNGSAVSGNYTVILYDSNGAILANSASTAQSGTAAYQKVPFATAYQAKGPAKYFVGIQIDNTTARIRTHILGNFGASKKTGQTYGTLTALTAPTTFTTGLGPIADLY
ncbi:MAG: hypothetical protein WC718_01505 [Phycisphaerales bacterium]|jgi:hypothetical protein